MALPFFYICLLILTIGSQTFFCTPKMVSAFKPSPKLEDVSVKFIKEAPLNASLLQNKLVLRAFSTYTTDENRYHYSLQITNKSLFLKLGKGKQERCRHSFALRPREQSFLELAVQGLRYCQRKSNIREMLHDVAQNIVEVHRGLKKDVYQRYKILGGSLPYLCKGQEKFYTFLARILQSKDLSSCPDYSILVPSEL